MYSVCYRCGVILDPPKTRGYCNPCWSAYYRDRRAQHPAVAKAHCAASKRWRDTHPGGNLAAVKKWRNANRKTWNAYQVRLAAANPARYRGYFAKSRTKRKGAPGSHTFTEWLRVLEAQKFRCLYCECALTAKTASPDHATPLSRGGTNDISNIVAACLSCNHRKHAKTREEFAKIARGRTHVQKPCGTVRPEI